MSRAAEILGPLAAAGGGVEVRPDGGLRYTAPAHLLHLLTDELRVELKAHETEIVAWLRSDVRTMPPEDLLAFNIAPDAYQDNDLDGPVYVPPLPGKHNGRCVFFR